MSREHHSTPALATTSWRRGRKDGATAESGGSQGNESLKISRGDRVQESNVRPEPLLVAIVGGSGAGKSWLAKKLKAALNPDAAHFSLDNFYRDCSRVRPERRAKINFDHPRAIDWPMMEKVLNDLRAGREARLPQYDFKTHCRIRQRSVLTHRPVVLVDGLWLLHRRSLRRVFGLKIFIDCPARTRRGRRVLRDLRSRGRTRASILEQLKSTVEPMHARFVAPQQKWADIVLRHNFGAAEVRRLARELRERLSVPGPANAGERHEITK